MILLLQELFLKKRKVNFEQTINVTEMLQKYY